MFSRSESGSTLYSIFFPFTTFSSTTILGSSSSRRLRRGVARKSASMNSLNPNLFLHAANVLLLVAYSVRDVLWLRLFAVAASLIAIPYFVLQPTRLWVPHCVELCFCVYKSVSIVAALCRASTCEIDLRRGGGS